jgi:hypothetical protein
MVARTSILEPYPCRCAERRGPCSALWCPCAGRLDPPGPACCARVFTPAVAAAAQREYEANRAVAFRAHVV